MVLNNNLVLPCKLNSFDILSMIIAFPVGLCGPSQSNRGTKKGNIYVEYFIYLAGCSSTFNANMWQ